MSSNVLFCTANSLKSKHIQFTVIKKKIKNPQGTRANPRIGICNKLIKRRRALFKKNIMQNDQLIIRLDDNELSVDLLN